MKNVCRCFQSKGFTLSASVKARPTKHNMSIYFTVMHFETCALDANFLKGKNKTSPWAIFGQDSSTQFWFYALGRTHQTYIQTIVLKSILSLWKRYRSLKPLTPTGSLTIIFFGESLSCAISRHGCQVVWRNILSWDEKWRSASTEDPRVDTVDILSSC